jgi:RIO kinase 1
VFDGALRRAYHHAASDDGGGGDDDDDDGLNPFFDDDASHAAAAGARAAAAAPTASRAARRAGARRERDKSDRATVETVLDPRTRLVLFKLLNAGVFAAIHGCVSTGKEANVYFAVGGPASPHAALAVKVYKTSILAFKDRHRYVTGDYRYERGYGGGGNARRMVRLWAEKEARNLARLAAAGVPCPSVVTLRSHVLAMSFIGSDGEAAPRLKDARLSRRRAVAAHRDVLLSMRALYARARLVHADLSEYNLLYHEGAVIVIDVSQSVDLDHPRALDFLRRDAVTVASFFARRGVVTLSTRACFDFVTDPRPLSRAEEEAALDAALAAAEADEADGAADAADGADGANAPPTADDAADAVFMAAHIPRRLADVDDCERDAGRLAQGGRAAEGIFYQALAGMTQDMTRVVRDGGGGEEAEGGEGGDAEEAPSSSDDGDDATTSDDDSDGDDDPASRPPRDRRATARACTLPPDEAAAARAERRAAKAVVKEAARERRTTKTPKHVKKRATKGKKKKK